MALPTRKKVPTETLSNLAVDDVEEPDIAGGRIAVRVGRADFLLGRPAFTLPIGAAGFPITGPAGFKKAGEVGAQHLRTVGGPA
jgi:hypothetical protein